MSTDEVYGPHESILTANQYRPSSPYAASKAAQEVLCHAWQRTYGVPLTIVNSANMIGERQRETAFLPTVVEHVRQNAVVPVHAHDGEFGVRHYSYVGNVVAELVAELQRDEPSGRLLLGGQRTLTNLELVEAVAAVIGVEPYWRSVEATVGRPGYDQRYPSLGSTWEPRVPFHEALERTVRWYLDR
jgi:dTDP-D-glucose 4,6-dehydratase